MSHGQQAMVVRGVGVVRSMTDIENIVVASINGTPLFVRDVGRVKIGSAIPAGIFGLDSRSGKVEGVVAMRRGENPSEVLAGVRHAIAELNESGLPDGVRIVPFYDRSELIDNTLHTVSRTLAEGLTIVFLVLVFFLGSLQAALLTALTVPMSLLFAFGVMHLYGIPASLLSLGALDFGIIVVPAVNGSRIPLSRLAEINVSDGASIVARRENRRQISVRTNIRGRDQGSFVAEAQRKCAERISLPAGYRLEWGGQFENLQRARLRLVWILPVTVVIIFTLLYWTFGSAVDASLVLANVPFSVAGGIAALYVRDINLSVSAAVGFVSLFGIAVMGGVLYLSEINRQLHDHERPLKEAVLVGACAQFRPLMMLILIAILGIMPAAFATGIGSDIQRPMATVIVGGLTSTLILALLALPVLCYLAKRPRPLSTAKSLASC